MHLPSKQGVVASKSLILPFQTSDGTNFDRNFSVSVERWCRLRGNLLFYFKSRDHWSEPAGVIVIEDCEVRSEAASPLDDSTFGIVLSFGGGQLQHLATYTEVRQFTQYLEAVSSHLFFNFRFWGIYLALGI